MNYLFKATVIKNCEYGDKPLLVGDIVYISDYYNFGKRKIFDSERQLIHFGKVDDLFFAKNEDSK